MMLFIKISIVVNLSIGVQIGVKTDSVVPGRD